MINIKGVIKLVFSCECGKLIKGIKEINDVVRDLVCPMCNTKLIYRYKSIPRQAKLDSWISLDKDELDKKRKLIYETLLKRGLTDRELAKNLGFSDPNKVRPRRKELVDMNLVKPNIKRVCEVSGKNVTEWVAI